MRGSRFRVEEGCFVVSHPRKARCEAGIRFRSDRGDFWLFAGRWRAADSSCADEGGPQGRVRHRQTGAQDRGSQRCAYYAADVSEAYREDRRETGGTDLELPDAAVAEAGAILGG